MFDALIKLLFEGKNINQKMTLRNQLKNVKIQNADIVMATLDHGTPLFKESVPERSYSTSADYGKNSLKKKLG